ncbi:RND family efflux transporter, MFP subunit [Bryocella elongata]|uniref:RND family efflux transporter, MFP subunit n=1 Tax=Bryocella elongata TaxID=863522 RepID=A0A1H5ZJW4_9BACT|nr:efflux RND transporter periplasmic adaptor subunit [Bryocella elongata]SEG36511.1 RND family efflux transporter, MFP subunit [Bryocella elongata]
MISTQKTPTRDRTQATSGGHIKMIGVGVVVLLALVAIGAVPRVISHREALAATTQAPVTHPVVTIIHATRGEPTSDLSLPGNIEPLYSADLFARVDGYIDRRNVDIGTRVHAGEVLAVISSPELDQQLSEARATVAQSQAALLQARASLEQSRANAELTRLTKERDIPLGQEHAISQQIVDSAVQSHNARLADVTASEANIVAAQATVAANQANVARLEKMQGFERIVAPFDGVITQRNVERGDLVNASASAGSKPLFSIAQSSTLRVYVDVPQSQAVDIHDGQTANINVTERLGRTYTGTITRNASALNDAARTMRTEVQVDNRDGSLLPGMYAQVHFTLSQQRASLIIPTSSLVIDHSGMHVVTVDSTNKLHFIPVTIGKDLGKEIEILAGLTGSESLVASPSDLLSEGQHVELR